MNNGSGSVWQSVTVTASGQPTVPGNLFVPRTPAPFSYDLDGNMTSDGRWNYTWDAENRLVKVESRSDTPQTSWWRVEWQYDALGRRIRQRTLVWTSSAWVVIEDLKLISLLETFRKSAENKSFRNPQHTDEDTEYVEVPF